MDRLSDLPEDFLHLVWKQHLFNTDRLVTTSGKSIQIINEGYQNLDAGPDFENAEVIIDDIRWVGNIEIHTKASEWYQHQHHHDDRYENVILHVVLHHDKEVLRKDQTKIPCLELKGRIRQSVVKKYEYLQTQLQDIPCTDQLPHVDRIKKLITLDRMVAERLEEKSVEIFKSLDRYNGDWRELTFSMLAKTLGYKVNHEAMTDLTNRITYKNLLKHKDHSLQIEAMLFGVSGLISGNHRDSYIQSLQNEYQFLQKKYDLSTMNPVSWKFSRMRPANFPTLRIAQLASITQSVTDLYSTFVEAEDPDKIKALLSIEQSEYWKSHVLPGEQVSERFKGMGDEIKNRILINTVIPLIFATGIKRQDQSLKDKAIQWLEKLPPENNKIIRQWKSLDFNMKSALDTQAGIQLLTRYCHHKRCLQCPIGMDILSSELINS